MRCLDDAVVPILELDRVTARRGADSGDQFELNVERLVVRPGERIVVIGDNGTGKSTLLDLLSLTLAPREAVGFRMTTETGTTDIAALWRRRDLKALAVLRAGAIGYVLQTGGLLPFLTVRQNVLLPLQINRIADTVFAESLLEELQLSGLTGRKPAALSVGQRQRVAVARALVHRPRLVLADEPTASLDPASATAVFGLFTKLVERLGMATVLVSHDRAVAERHGFKVIECRMAGRKNRLASSRLDMPAAVDATLP